MAKKNSLKGFKVDEDEGPAGPGEGYRWLEADETLRGEDEYLLLDGWHTTAFSGGRAGKSGVYRRRIYSSEVSAESADEQTNAKAG